MNHRGFTIVEVLIALILLTVGALALAAGSGMAVRMIGRGGQLTEAATLAAGRIEILRRLGRTGSPGCGALVSGSLVPPGQLAEQWWVSGSGAARTVVVVVSYPGRWATSGDSVATVIRCA